MYPNKGRLLRGSEVEAMGGGGGGPNDYFKTVENVLSVNFAANYIHEWNWHK
jgi:hypothetical protein